MDTELEFDTPIDLLDGVTDEYTEDAEAGLEAPVAPAPQPAAPEAEEGPAQSALTAYMRSLSRSQLLNAEQEQKLGAELLSAREEMANALGSVPALVLELVRAWRETVTGDRPASEVLQWPLGAPARAPSGELGPEEAARAREAVKLRMAELETLHRDWAAATAKGQPLKPKRVRRRMAELFVEAAPAFGMLCALRALGSAVADDPGVEPDELSELLARAERAEVRYQAARGTMLEANLRLVFHIASRFAPSARLPLEDLVQEGNLGLLRAIEKFDHRLGYKFSTYASNWIWQSVTRALAERQRLIRVPTHVHDKILKLWKVSRDLEQERGRAPDQEELAEVTGLPEATVKRALESSRTVLSLDSPVGAEDDGATFLDFATDSTARDHHEVVHEDQIETLLEGYLSVLSPREATILRLRHGIGGQDPRTLEEVGEVLGVTRERARQIQNRAMRKLRASIGSERRALLAD